MGNGDTPPPRRRPSSQQSSQDDDRDVKSTVVERPPSGPPHAMGSHSPAPKSEPPRRSRRSIPPRARYTSGEEIGRGGMGRVVEATDTLLDRRVAVKEALTTDPELLRRFARETKITARLEHPSIVPVYDAGTADGSPFYVMRRVTGRPLSELIRAAPTLEERLALVPHLLAAAQAIAHAHQRGIIHRDIKPANILVGDLGETVVIDWGLAKVIGEPDDDSDDAREPDPSGSLRTRMGVVFGTPGFMDPNQLRGDVVGVQGDVYSLGASLYNLLAAEPPHYANDSTQMMKLASLGPPQPLSEVVPGVPAELSTIVDTATDYDVTRRYKDAGAFAEELKRFLAGQLVASHRYSRTERFVRFVRQHRAAVAIGGAATVLLAFVGTFAVSQVIGERDRADEQARLATQGRHEAEAARAMADERADQLLISRARALVETNPTGALASLKQLSPKSKRIDEARAIVSAARIRGVAWAMKASDVMSSIVVLDPSVLRLAQMTTDGFLHVYDLDARRTVFEVDVGRGAQPRWIHDGKLLLVGGTGATRLFDPSGKEQPTDLPEFRRIETDERGVVLVLTDSTKRAVRIDLETNTTTVLAEGARDVAVGDDGRYVAVITNDDCIVFDHTTAITHHPHPDKITRAVISQAKVAVLEGAAIFQAPLAANAKWSELKVLGSLQYQPYWIEYNKERLFAMYTDSRILGEYEGTMREVGRIQVTSGGMQPFGEHFLAVGADGRRIYYVDGVRMRDFYLPIALRFNRIVARQAHPRIVAVGDGAIVVLDLETLPQLLPIEDYQATMFMSDRTLMSSNASTFNYGWYDIVDRRATRVPTNGATHMRSFDRAQARVLLFEASDVGRRALVFTVGATKPSEVIKGPFDDVQLIGGGGLLYSLGNKVFGGFTGTRRPELFATNGTVLILVRLDGTRYAVVAERELVRGDLRTGAIERLALPEGPEVAYGVGQNGALVIARGEQIWKWTGTKLVQVVKLEANAEMVYPLDKDRLLVTMTNHSTVHIGPDGAVTRLASTRGSVLASPDRVIVPGQIQYDVIELPSFARWALPITRATDAADVQLDISPDGRLVIEKTHDGRLWLWRVPLTDDFTAAVNATNLSEDPNGLLLWPWQKPDQPK